MENNCNIKPKNFKELLKSSWIRKPLLGIAIGAAIGFLYYYFVGCSSGSCPITSNPYGSMVAGGVLGLFFTNNPCLICNTNEKEDV
jgi:hypothetical protein